MFTGGPMGSCSRGAVAGMLLILYEFHSHYVKNYNPDRFPWTLAAPLVGAPVALFLWYIRDQVKVLERRQKSRDQEQKDLDRLQVDFHKYTEWASSSDDIALRKVALNNLKTFITGEVFPKPEANAFRIPGLSLLSTLISLGTIAKKKVRKSRNEADQVALAIFPHVEEVFRDLLSKDHGETFSSVRIKNPFRAIVEEGKSILQGLYLPESNLEWAKLEGAKLHRANLKLAKLREADLQGADLAESNLQETNLNRANLNGANLKTANLQEANLIGANLQGAKLNGANLNGANLREANLLEIKGWASIQTIQGANITSLRCAPDGFEQWALYHGAVFGRPEYLKIILDGVDGWPNLQGIDLQGAHLQGINLASAYLPEANLQMANLRGANLKWATLWEANLKDIQYWKEIESIENADITGVKNAPKGFVEWALENGAVIHEDDAECLRYPAGILLAPRKQPDPPDEKEDNA